ncbi:uncharacterized protein LY89DRAFT_776217 [Mollisia scopiformis]|uniref:Uncharacterized protein n=1 Tax=Mollisia scopiformis TaxID=149040 RepID=A0A194XUY7_MOLSC|nr:uncharacterized protein LY89DRAFT_776217 [Mollisia scopiformis]KUJ24023.1 hypothetical protein LY89DRAFT_776217 [Mollisia scopiformis]
MTYGYNANIWKDTAIGGVEQPVSNLVRLLRQERVKAINQICDTIPTPASCFVKGCLFLGVPHIGSKVATDWATVLGRFQALGVEAGYIRDLTENSDKLNENLGLLSLTEATQNHSRELLRAEGNEGLLYVATPHESNQYIPSPNTTVTDCGTGVAASANEIPLNISSMSLQDPAMKPRRYMPGAKRGESSRSAGTQSREGAGGSTHNHNYQLHNGPGPGLYGTYNEKANFGTERAPTIFLSQKVAEFLLATVASSDVDFEFRDLTVSWQIRLADLYLRGPIGGSVNGLILLKKAQITVESMKERGETYRDQGRLYSIHAVFLIRTGRNEEALVNLELAVKIHEIINGKEDHSTLRSYFELGAHALNLRHFEKAERALAAVISGLEKNQGPASSDMKDMKAQSYMAMAMLHENNGDRKQVLFHISKLEGLGDYLTGQFYQSDQSTKVMANQFLTYMFGRMGRKWRIVDGKLCVGEDERGISSLIS